MKIKTFGDDNNNNIIIIIHKVLIRMSRHPNSNFRMSPGHLGHPDDDKHAFKDTKFYSNYIITLYL